jgi:hypothetical protein
MRIAWVTASLVRADRRAFPKKPDRLYLKADRPRQTPEQQWAIFNAMASAARH